MKLVLKIGGAALENPATLQSCIRAIKSLVQDGHQLVVVHGGGSALTRKASSLTACA
jgi:acetylglutamate kinase